MSKYKILGNIVSSITFCCLNDIYKLSICWYYEFSREINDSEKKIMRINIYFLLVVKVQ